MRRISKLIRTTLRLSFYAGAILSIAFTSLLVLTPSVSLEPTAGRLPTVNDVTGMNAIPVGHIIAPRTVEEVQLAVRNHDGPISIGGGRFSMGGQTASPGSLHIDMRGLNGIEAVDRATRSVKVQAGVTWRALQEELDKQDLSVKIMQSYANFTVGGSLSVNVHGRYIGEGPLVRSVSSLRIVLADGTLVEADREHRPEIFYGAIGGYGGIGVLVDATLQLAENVKIERVVTKLNAAEYPDYFRKSVRDNHDVIFQNGDLIPPDHEEVYSVVWRKTDKPLTESMRLPPLGPNRTWKDAILAPLILDMPGGVHLRRILEPYRYSEEAVVMRNFEASYDVETLSPISTSKESFVLQEYFIPVERFAEFLPRMREILLRHDVDVINISVRHALPDPDTYLSWAPTEVFAFVLYYRQFTDPTSRNDVSKWTRELIDASLASNGSYYLPYQTHATREQFMKAFPRARDLFELKRSLDPTYKFRNIIWDSYFEPTTDRLVLEAVRDRPDYFRPEVQTYLTLPEWNLVYASDELARTTGHGPQSDFRFFGAIADFWRTFAVTFKINRGYYPANWGYHLMNGVIGIHTSIEYLLKGVLENTLGRFSAAVEGASGPPAPGSVDVFIHDTFTQYAEFIHETPWYSFPWGAKFSALWNLERGGRQGRFRFYERKLTYGAELASKALLSRLFTIGTEAVYGTENLRIEAVVAGDRERLLSLMPQAEIRAEITPDVFVVSLPRYESLTRMLKSIDIPDDNSLRFLEIAGNKRIAVTVLAPESWATQQNSYPVILDEYTSRPGLRRVAVSAEVPALLAFMKKCKSEAVEVVHVYDY